MEHLGGALVEAMRRSRVRREGGRPKAEGGTSRDGWAAEPFGRQSIGDHGVRREIHSYEIVLRLGKAPRSDLMESDPQLSLVDGDSKITVVSVVVFLEQEPAHFHRRFRLE